MLTALERIEVKLKEQPKLTIEDLINPVLRKNRFFIECARMKKPYSTENIIKLLNKHLALIIKEHPKMPESNYMPVLATVLNYLVKANSRNLESLSCIKLAIADLFKQMENHFNEIYKDKKEKRAALLSDEFLAWCSIFREEYERGIDRLSEAKTMMTPPLRFEDFQKALENSSLIDDHSKPKPQELVTFFVVCIKQFSTPQKFLNLVNINVLIEQHREVIETDQKAAAELKAAWDSISTPVLQGVADIKRRDISFLCPVNANIIENLHRIAYTEHEPYPSLTKIPDSIKKAKIHQTLVQVIPSIEDKEALAELKNYFKCEINIITELLNMPTGLSTFIDSTAPTANYCEILDLLDRREKELADDLDEDPTSKIICGL